MKKTIFVLLALVLLALPAISSANPIIGATYQSYSGASFTGGYIPVSQYRTKTFITTGYYTVAGAKANTYGNYSGTILIQDCASSAGPCATAKTLGGTSMSMTAPGILSWESTAPYIRVVWTKTKHMLGVWLFGQQY